MSRVLGVIGAGKLGATIGRAAADAGWQVLFYDVAPAAQVQAAVAAASPGASAMSAVACAEARSRSTQRTFAPS